MKLVDIKSVYWNFAKICAIKIADAKKKIDQRLMMNIQL